MEQQVRQFYNDVGWTRDQRGALIDGSLWEDERVVTARYTSRCRRRIVAWVTPPIGQRSGVLLDIGSGPVQHPEFRTLHERFERVVLLDLSERALHEAPSGGRYDKVLASATSLPMCDASIDRVFCNNVINHVEAPQQRTVVDEALRVLKPGGRAVFVSYNPHRTRPQRWFRHLRPNPASIQARMRRSLFSAPPSLDWWRSLDVPARLQLVPVRFLFVSDSQALVPDNCLGRVALSLLGTIEHIFRGFALHHGAYYAAILDKQRE